MARASVSNERFASIFSLEKHPKKVNIITNLKADILTLVQDFDITQRFRDIPREDLRKLDIIICQKHPSLYDGNKRDIKKRIKLTRLFMQIKHNSRRHLMKVTRSHLLPSTEDENETTVNKATTTILEPASSPQAVISKKPTTKCIATNLTEMEELHDFLSTSDPPLTRYVSLFTAAGVRNSKQLRAVSKFPDDILKEFIDSLRSDDGSREMSALEKVVLRVWFKEYFCRLDEK